MQDEGCSKLTFALDVAFCANVFLPEMEKYYRRGLMQMYFFLYSAVYSALTN